MTVITGKVSIIVTLKVEIVKGSRSCIQSKVWVETPLDELIGAFKYLADKSVENIKGKPGFHIKNKSRTISIVETDYLGKQNRKVDGFEFSNTQAVLKDIAREYSDMVGSKIIVPVDGKPLIVEK